RYHKSPSPQVECTPTDIAERQTPDRRPDSISADDEIVAFPGSVAEVSEREVIRQFERDERHAHFDGYDIAALPQDEMQICPVKRYAGSDPTPKRAQVHLAQQSLATVAEPLRFDPGSALLCLSVQFQRTKGTDGIARQVHTSAGIIPAGTPLDDVGRAAVLSQRPAQCETSYAGTHNQYPQSLQIQDDLPATSLLSIYRLPL